MKRLSVAVVLVMLSACQTAPTKIHEVDNRSLSVLVKKTAEPIRLTDDLKVLDARSAFDYGLNRIKNSQPLGWQDLMAGQSACELSNELHRVGLRLSLLGITPSTPVLIIGYGTDGHGEEGRLAWELLYYGLRDVQVSALGPFEKAMTANPSPTPLNAPVWTPQVRHDLLIDKKSFKRWMSAKARAAHGVFILDVRSAREYLRPDHADIQALNIEWKQFYTAEGRPDPLIRQKLLAYGVKLHNRIIVISNHGVRAGAAAYALLALGFTDIKVPGSFCRSGAKR